MSGDFADRVILKEQDKTMKQSLKTILILFLLVGTKLSAQNDSIRANRLYLEAIQFDSYISTIDHSGTVRFDSIFGVSKHYKHKVRVESYFKKSKTKLDIDYYFSGTKLYLIVLKELNPIDYSCWLQSEYYYDSGNIFMTREKQLFTSDITMSGEQKIKNSMNSYNSNLNNAFLRTFIVELWEKVKNYP